MIDLHIHSNFSDGSDSYIEILKKAMLSRIINKVYLGKDEIEIELNIWLSDYFEGNFD